MPGKRRLVTSKVCFGSEKAGLLDHSYNKCALATGDFQSLLIRWKVINLSTKPFKVRHAIVYHSDN